MGLEDVLAGSNRSTISFEEYKEKIKKSERPQITTGVPAQMAFADSLCLVCSVSRPLNDGELNSRSIIIPNHPPSHLFLEQLCSKVTAAITAWQRRQHNALQTGFNCGKRSRLCYTGTTRMYRCTACSPDLMYVQFKEIRQRDSAPSHSTSPFLLIRQLRVYSWNVQTLQLKVWKAIKADTSPANI